VDLYGKFEEGLYGGSAAPDIHSFINVASLATGRRFTALRVGATQPVPWSDARARLHSL